MRYLIDGILEIKEEINIEFTDDFTAYGERDDPTDFGIGDIVNVKWKDGFLYEAVIISVNGKAL